MYRILIVDDEMFVRKGLKELIDWQEYGFEICCEADNGIEAVEKVKTFNPNLIITDIKMPEMDGLEFIKNCFKLGINAKYIILSGFNEFQYAREAMKYGVSNYILKPIDEDELKECLNKIRFELNSKEVKNYIDYKEIAEDILLQYIHGKINENILNKLKQNIPSYDNGEFRYIAVKPIIDIEKIEEVETNCKRIKTVLENISGENKSMYIINESTELGIIITKDVLKKYDNNLKELYRFISDDIKRITNLEVMVYSGKKVKGIKAIRESYHTSQMVSNINFLFGRKGFIEFEEMNKYNLSYTEDIDLLFQGLMEAVERNNTEKINNLVKEFSETVRNKLVSPSLIITGVIKFELEIIKLVTKINEEATELYKYINIIKENPMFLSDVELQLAQFSYSAANKLIKEETDYIGSLLNEVMEYINNNFDKSISLKYLSEHFYINHAYLGQIFKKKFGVSFNDYINNMRIDKAKQLIVSEGLRVHEIATLVGYNDCNYFINKFEKITNKTPAEYRKLMKNCI